jgi:type IX secretion system PorP/SprF family membrane protein
MKKKYITLFFAICRQMNLLTQNNIHFTQFYNAPTELNPALTGQFDGLLIYRQQWSGASNISSDFFTKTLQGSVDLSIGNKQFGIGLSAINDVTGNSVFNSNRFMLSLAYGLKFEDNHILSFGAQGMYYGSSLNTESLNFATPNPILFNSSKYYDFNIGLNYHIESEMNRIDFGISGHQLLGGVESFKSTNDSSNKVPKYYKAYSIIEWAFDDELKIMPGFFGGDQAGATNFLIGSNVGFQLRDELPNIILFAGIWNRINKLNYESILPLIGVEMSKVRFMISYDHSFSLNKLNSTPNTIEMSISYRIPTPRERGFSDCFMFNPRF